MCNKTNWFRQLIQKTVNEIDGIFIKFVYVLQHEVIQTLKRQCIRIIIYILKKENKTFETHLFTRNSSGIRLNHFTWIDWHQELEYNARNFF